MSGLNLQVGQKTQITLRGGQRLHVGQNRKKSPTNKKTLVTASFPLNLFFTISVLKLSHTILNTKARITKRECSVSRRFSTFPIFFHLNMPQFATVDCSLRLLTATFGRSCSGGYPSGLTNGVFFISLSTHPQQSCAGTDFSKITSLATLATCLAFFLFHRSLIPSNPAPALTSQKPPHRSRRSH